MAFARDLIPTPIGGYATCNHRTRVFGDVIGQNRLKAAIFRAVRFLDVLIDERMQSIVKPKVVAGSFARYRFFLILNCSDAGHRGNLYRGVRGQRGDI